MIESENKTKILALKDKNTIDNILIDGINKEYQETYDYIVFPDSYDNIIKFNDYMTYNFFCKKNFYINRLRFNTILINNAISVVNYDGIEILFFLQYIIDEDIKQNDFSFKKELKKLKRKYKLEKKSIDNFKRVIINLIKEHYAQDSLLRKIKFYAKSNNVIKVFLYKLILNIINDINNEIKVIEI